MPLRLLQRCAGRCASRWGLFLIRTVWLAAFCLAGIAGLCASKVTSSYYDLEDVPAEPATQAAAAQPDTLTQADRLDLSWRSAVAATALTTGTIAAARVAKPSLVAVQAPEQPVLSSQPVPRKLAASAKRRARTKVAAAKTQATAARAAVEPKTCPQPEGLNGLLMAFNANRC